MQKITMACLEKRYTGLNTQLGYATPRTQMHLLIDLNL